MSQRARRKRKFGRAPIRTVIVQDKSSLETVPKTIIVRYVSTSVQTEDPKTRMEFEFLFFCPISTNMFIHKHGIQAGKYRIAIEP